MIATAATASRPRTRYTIERDAAILVRLARVVSDQLLDRILRLGLGAHYVKNLNQARFRRLSLAHFPLRVGVARTAPDMYHLVHVQRRQY